MSAQVEWVGLNDLEVKLRDKADNIDNLVSEIIYDVALQVFEESQRIVPVDTGALRSSGIVIPPRKQQGGVVAEIVYGGAASEYALYVHEDLTAFHMPPTQAKFLEQPLAVIGEPLLQQAAEAGIRDYFKK